MYATETSRDVREEIIQALFIAGDVERIGEDRAQARRTRAAPRSDPQARPHGREDRAAAAALYASETSIEMKEAVIEALFLQGNARALIDLAKKETNRELKREILQKLSVMGNNEAVEYMLEILNEERRAAMNRP